MLNFLKLLLLKLVSKNLDDIIAMFLKLDQKLEVFITQETAKRSGIQATLESLTEELRKTNENLNRAQTTKDNIKALVGAGDS